MIRKYKKYTIAFFAAALIVGSVFFVENAYTTSPIIHSETEFDKIPTDTISANVTNQLESLPPIIEPLQDGRIQWSRYWQDMTPEELRIYGSLPPNNGLLRVGIQAGHWQLENVPEELDGLKASSGARGGGVTEQATVLEIARRTKTLLEAQGILVDLLPATIPVDYVADAFVSIHADGSTSSKVSGFKISAPRKDFSEKAQQLVDALYTSYQQQTKLPRESSITRRMTGYYAFNWRRYDHALHPLTPAVIIETGFMTSATDRAVIVNQPQRVAEGIAQGILTFLQ